MNAATPIRRAPIARAIPRFAAGWVESQSRTPSASQAIVPYTPAWVAAMIAPRTRAWPAIDPLSGRTNCGNTASMKTYAFGFMRLVSAARVKVSRGETSARGPSRARPPAARHRPQPIQAT